MKTVTFVYCENIHVGLIFPDSNIADEFKRKTAEADINDFSDLAQIAAKGSENTVSGFKPKGFALFPRHEEISMRN